MSAHTISLTDSNFEQEVLESNVPVLIDFWAAWCGPCRLINPIVEALATEYSGRVKIAKLHIDDHPEIATQYQISAVPTLLIFNQGKVVDGVVGVATQKVLAAKLDALLEQDDSMAVPAA